LKAEKMSLVLFQRLLARALVADDAVAAVAALGENPRLPHVLRSAAQQAAPDGVRVSALLVAKLRFERLMRGDARLRAWFEQSPRVFVETFRRYHAEESPVSSFPRAEAQHFGEWLQNGQPRDRGI
jgi:hypothetical protein